MRNGRVPNPSSIKPYLLAAILLLLFVWLIHPYIAHADSEQTPPYLTTSDLLDAEKLSWEQMTQNPSIVEWMVRNEFPDAPVMVDIARAESRFNPQAKNPGSTATGVFQILIGTWEHFDCAGSRINPLDNIACARKIYDRNGTSDWNASKASW